MDNKISKNVYICTCHGLDCFHFSYQDFFISMNSSTQIPERRARILQATLDMLVEHGISHITHRKIAQAAEVSLGSMTYYFTGIDSLIREAFAQFTFQMSAQFRLSMQEANNVDKACEAIADMICGGTMTTPYNMQVMFQLYACANCHPELKKIMQEWMTRSQQSLALFFDPLTAKGLDAFIEGMTLHYVTDEQPLNREQVLVIVKRITGVAS